MSGFVARDMRPINVVEGEGFRDLIHTLEPGYTVPRRATVMAGVHTKFESTKAVVSNLINSCESVSLTTDIWTSLTMEAYLTVTVHFVTADWRLECFVLETKKMAKSHTAANIEEILSEIISDWAIPRNTVASIVHDNGSNIVKCTDQMNEDPAWGGVKGVRCAGHTLQLCINAALKKYDNVTRTVAAAKRLVTHFKKSAKATTALIEKQKDPALPVKCHKLIQEVGTRWNSTYMMLQRLIEQREAVAAVLSDVSVSKQSDRNLELTTAQWRTAEDIVSVLKPMITLTELLSQDINASLSATVPMLINIKNRHLAVRDDDSNVIKNLKTTITQEIVTRWSLESLQVSSVYIQAAVLDPRFKKLNFFTDEQTEEAYSAVENLAESIAENAHRPVRVREESLSDSDREEQPPTAPPKQNEKAQIVAMLMDVDEEEEQTEDEGNEMKAYIKDNSYAKNKKDMEKEKEKNKDMKIKEQGPLEWWKKNEDRYPQLSRAAKRIHSIPATSTSSERIFSKAGFIINKKRSALLPRNANRLIFLAHNLKRLNRRSQSESQTEEEDDDEEDDEEEEEDQ